MQRRRSRSAGVALIAALALSGCASPSEAPASPGPSGPASPSAAVSATPSPTPSSGPTAPTTTHVVQAGETLSSIARTHGVSVPELQAWNADRYPSLVDDPDTLQVGWTLVVGGQRSATPPPGAPTAAPPAGTSPPAATGCRAGDRVPAGGQETFRTVPGAGNEVALTFDMGGRIEPAVEIMNFLVANGVCATIFPTGAMSQTPEGRQVMAIIRDHPELFEVGNHTMHHCDLGAGGGGSPSAAPCPAARPGADFIQRELTDAAAILEAETGQSPVPYWRPPYGSYDQAVLDAAAAVGYTKTFMWDIDTIDWQPVSAGGPTAEQIAGKVVNNAVGGSNVLMHLGGWNTLDALPAMVSGLRARGFLLTSLSDLLS